VNPKVLPFPAVLLTLTSPPSFSTMPSERPELDSLRSK